MLVCCLVRLVDHISYLPQTIVSSVGFSRLRTKSIVLSSLCASNVSLSLSLTLSFSFSLSFSLYQNTTQVHCYLLLPLARFGTQKEHESRILTLLRRESRPILFDGIAAPNKGIDMIWSSKWRDKLREVVILISITVINISSGSSIACRLTLKVKPRTYCEREKERRSFL